MPASAMSPRAARLASAAAIVVALAAGAGTLAGFAGRHGWLLELCSHFRVQYFWALAISAVVLGIARRKRLALAAAALATLNLALIVPLYWGVAPVRPPRSSARALLLNVRWLNNQYQRTLDLIRQESPDFCFLVEVTPQWAEALEELHDEYPHGQVVDKRGSRGMALLSRVPVESLEVERIAETRLPTIVARLKLADGSLTVVGTHPPSPTNSENFASRNEQLANVAQIVRQQTGPVLLMGDLNMTGWSPFFADLLESAGLHDTRRGFGVEASWPNLPRVLRIPIDHCLTSGGIVVLDRRISPAVGSDHRGVILDFALEQGR